MEDQDELNIEFSTDILALLNGLRPDSDNANVYTPQDVVKKMLDILPKDIWTNREVKFLDPVCKSGVYLREITKRLVDAQIKADGKKLKGKDRLPYIQRVLKNQVYGIAISEEAALVSRRTVYGSQNAMSKYSLSEGIFEDVQGNIRFVENVTTENKKGNQYPFLTKTIQEIYGDNMHFDVIIGNPPYQDEGGSGGNNDASIYQFFCEKATQLEPKYSCFIIPARWFAAGRENLVGPFRNYMLSCGRIRKLVVYADAGDCFRNVEIKGGCCYYLEDRDYNGTCCYELIRNGEREIVKNRNLGEFDVLIREPKFAKIVKKVDEIRIANGEGTVDTIISSDTPFGIPSNPRTSKKTPFNVYENCDENHDVKLFHIQNNKRMVEYVCRDDIEKNSNDIAFDKVFVPGGYGAGESFPHQILGEPELGPQNSVCSQSYLYAKFNSEMEASNFLSYLKTKFFRALVGAIKITQSAPSRVYRFVPLQDFSRSWTDKDLYEKYGITEDEQAFIESMIRPME